MKTLHLIQTNVDLHIYCSCWNKDAELRPTMIMIHKKLQIIRHQMTVASNLDINLAYVDSDDDDEIEDNGGRHVKQSSSYTMTLLENPLILIKETYRKRFKSYNPFYFDLDFQFSMNSWIPIKLVKESNKTANRSDDDNPNDLFKLITTSLDECGIVVITGEFNYLQCN